MTENTETVAVSQLVTFADEFVGREFFGKAAKSKGRFVGAEFRNSGKTVEVTVDAPNVFGPLTSFDFATGAQVRVERRGQ